MTGTKLKPSSILDQYLTPKDRRDLADVIRNSLAVASRFISGVELESLRQTYLIPCPVKSAIGCTLAPCTREAILLDGNPVLASCQAGYSFAFVPVQVDGQLLAYLEIGPFFQDVRQREAFFGRRPELRASQAGLPVIASARDGAMALLAEWVSSVIRSRRDRDAMAKQETLLLYLVDSTKSIASMADTEELLTYLTDASTFLTDAYSGFLLRLDERARQLRIAVARGVGSDFNRNYRVPLGEGITGWVALHGQPLYVPDAAKDSRYLAVGYRAASELAVPIRSGQRLIGVLVVDSLDKDAFSDFHRTILESLASQAAKVMEATREETEGRAKLRQLEALHAVAQAINSTLSLPEVLSAVLRALSRVFSASGCAILLAEGERAELMVKVCGEDPVKTVRDVKIGGERGILGYVLRERRPLLLHPGDGELFDRFRDVLSSDIESLMCVPLSSSGDELLGTLFVMGSPRAHYDKADLDLAVTVAGQVSQAITKARLFERSQRQVAELSLINELSKAINSSLDLDNVLEYATTMLSTILEAESGSLMLLDRARQSLRIVCSKGLDAALVERVDFKVGEGIAGWVAEHRKPVLLADAGRDPRYLELDGTPKSFSMICAPIVHKDAVVGVINFERSLAHKRPFVVEDLELLSTLAGQAAMAIENAKLYRNLIQVHFETIQSLANALEAKDPYTHGHSRRVSKDAVRMAQRLDLPPKVIETIRNAAMLHDIGKIGVRDAVLLKPGRLDDEEYSHIKRHAALGATILEHVGHLREVAGMVRHHHERIDGNGYPHRLKGEEIPLGSRIICIADAFDAMITTRPYREGMSLEHAVAELAANRGTQFDAPLVDLFIELLKEHHPSLAPALDRAAQKAA
jgi:HD-GYP domain-containing protein (c-di-GMP phosphodiesterase class II)